MAVSVSWCLSEKMQVPARLSAASVVGWACLAVSFNASIFSACECKEPPTVIRTYESHHLHRSRCRGAMWSCLFWRTCLLVDLWSWAVLPGPHVRPLSSEYFSDVNCRNKVASSGSLTLVRLAVDEDFVRMRSHESTPSPKP